jgi:hypothetical protein
MFRFLRRRLADAMLRLHLRAALRHQDCALWWGERR